MYLPIDPLKDESIFKDLRQSLLAYPFSYVVLNGVFSDQLRTKIESASEVNKIISRFKKHQYNRVGTSRLKPCPPHYSVEHIDELDSELRELICFCAERSQIFNDLSKVIQLFFFQERNSRRLFIPGDFGDLDLEGFTINFREHKGITEVSRFPNSS